MKYIVTGANRGLGLEFVTQLAERGDEVIATCRTPEQAEELNALATSHDGVSVHQLDVANVEQLTAFVSAVSTQGAEVLINNAGIYPKGGSLGELNYDAFTQGFEVNAIAPIRLAEALLPHLTGAKIIANVTSQMGSIEDNGSGGSYAYRMSKAALNMGIKSLAIDTVDRGFTSFLLHPGWVQTDMGGPNAMITTTQSINGMLEVIDKSNTGFNGKFFGWKGNTIPW